MVKGADLGTTSLGNIRGGGNGNTHFGALGGLIVHEEYANTTTTANAATTLLLHSNNATHHSQGSRKFYNDTVNTAFYGAGTFSATPAAAPKGHEAAGYFKITASGSPAVYNFQGNTHSSAINTNPQLRLRRGYSYIFDFSGAGTTHQFYFANSTANTTGFKYGASTTQNNAQLTGLFGTNTDPNGAPAVTWTQLTTSNFGAQSGTNAYAYIKYEVPTDAPKNLYYRCSTSGGTHSTMGNAVFVMEATEPAPVKVTTLPALKTSGWNDRDFTGIGTNNSLLHFDGASYLTIPDHVNFHLIDQDSEWTFEAWVYPSYALSGDGWIISAASDANNRWQLTWASGKQFSWYIRINSVDRVSINTNSALGDLPTEQWYHVVMSRTTAGVYSIYVNGRLGVASSAWTGEWDNWAGNDIHIGRYPVSASDYWNGFMDEIVVHKIEPTAAAGSGAYSANTITQRYMDGRAGVHYTANSFYCTSY